MMHSSLIKGVLENVNKVFPLSEGCPAAHAFMMSHGGEGAALLLQIVWEAMDGQRLFYSSVFGEESITYDSLMLIRKNIEGFEEERVKMIIRKNIEEFKEEQVKLMGALKVEDFSPPEGGKDDGPK